MGRDLARVSQPLKLIYSRQDPSVTLVNSERVLSGVSSEERELRVLEDSSHVIPVDRERELVATEVVEFVTRLEQAVDASGPPGEC